MKVDSFSIAFFFVSGPIQSSDWIRSPIAHKRFFTISCMRALAAAGKYLSV